MRRQTRRNLRALLGIVVVAAVASLVMLVAGTAAASVPTGTWQLIPAQTSTAGTPATTTDTTTSYSYETAVRPPINADGSSVFSAKRGVVPVQFDVLAAPTTTTTTTTTTTHTYDPIVFESIGSDGFYPGGVQQTDDWSALIFTPAAGSMTFADVQALVATYDFTTGTCHGGSLRWSINVEHNNAPQNIHVYYGVPNGPDQQCTTGAADGSGENLMDDSAAVTNDRFEFQSAGAPVYTTYAAMLADTKNGTDTVNWIGLILDSGWGGDQIIDPTTLAASVNGNPWGGAESGTFDETVPGTPQVTTGDFAKTCAIPQAAINVVKEGQTAPTVVNEAVDSVQPKDSGVYFRNVDCKLIYNLDVSTLNGVGKYTVAADFGDGPVGDPALFGLK